MQKLHCTKEKEIIDSVGSLLQDWFPTLSPYVDYCSNLVVAKRVLEEKKSHPAVIDFLQRCLESEFSRKIDLWTFLGEVNTDCYAVTITDVHMYIRII